MGKNILLHGDDVRSIYKLNSYKKIVNKIIININIYIFEH